jgi:hypothetical protein
VTVHIPLAAFTPTLRLAGLSPAKGNSALAVASPTVSSRRSEWRGAKWRVKRTENTLLRTFTSNVPPVVAKNRDLAS